MYSKESLLFILFLVFFSCRQGDDSIEETAQEVSFRVNSIFDDSGRIADASLADAEFLLITIEKTDGSSTDYTSEKIELYQLDDEFVSEKIVLPPGDYELTEFFVTDNENNITHIAPLEGSEQAQNVSNPLPIEFSISADEITEVNVEVISSEGLSLEDFGLAGFNLTEIDLFNFLITITEQANLERLLDGTITIVSGDYQFSKELLAIANNNLIIVDGFSSYEVKIEKEGYEDFSYSFSRDSLGHYSSTPLVVALQSEASSTNTFTSQPDGTDGLDAILTNHSLDDFVNKNWDEYPNVSGQAWTRSGQPTTIRSLLQFDLSSIPTASEIESATLTLYGVAWVTSYEGEPGGIGHSSLTSSNAFEILRVTSEWEESTVTWNSRPSTTEDGKILLPESETEFQDYTIDVSEMVQLMVNDPSNNHGFMIKLTDETYYAQISFASSDYQTDAAKRPKLEVTYGQ